MNLGGSQDPLVEYKLEGYKVGGPFGWSTLRAGESGALGGRVRCGKGRAEGDDAAQAFTGMMGQALRWHHGLSQLPVSS